MENNKQDEKPIAYEQKPDDVKSDYTPQKTYTEKQSDRRDFLRKSVGAVVVGLGGILFGKTAMADGIDAVVGDNDENNSGGLRNVTNDYSASLDDCHPNCSPHCDPKACDPVCKPYCNPPPKSCQPEVR